MTNAVEMTSSVIICTRNRFDDLIRCLESIEVQTHLPDEVLIVDGSDDDQLGTLLKDQPFDALPIRYIHTEPGLTRQRNIGIEIASGEIMFFLDDDVALDTEYMEKVVDVYKGKRLNNVGGVQGIDLNVTKAFLEGKKRLLFHRLFFLKRNDRYSKLLPSGAVTHLDVASPDIRFSKKPIRIYCMSGAMMSYHQKVFDDLRFDENYEGYSHGEDIDFSHRVSKKYNMYFTSYAKAFHNKPSNKLEWYRTQDFKESYIRAQVYLFRKHLTSRPLNYFAILWSWFGLLAWLGIQERDKASFIGNLRGMRKEFLNIFKPINR